jgi:hypothetical protein
VSLGLLLKKLRDKPTEFNNHVLGRVHPTIPDGYWAKQQEVARSFNECPLTLVPSGHGTGKTFLSSGLALQYLFTRPNSIVLCFAPSAQQLHNALWPEIKKAFENSRLPLPGRVINGATPRIELGPKWYMQCRSADTEPERLQGTHAKHLACICDESSWDGYQSALEAIDSLNPERLLLVGNPLASGRFKTLCEAPPDYARIIHISSLEGPHIGMERSPVGLADASWLRRVESEYGPGSLYWTVRVEGRWPDDSTDILIPVSWMDRCREPHVPKGNRWLSVDLSAGTGRGDSSVWVVRDDNGIVAWDASAQWPYPEGVADQVLAAIKKYNIPPNRVVYDGTAIGYGFGSFLAVKGLRGARAYVGAAQGGLVATNLRSCAACALRDRLNPAMNAQPFHIPDALLERLRPEIKELRYTIGTQGRISLENKEDMKVRLKRSPDALDACIMSFGMG